MPKLTIDPITRLEGHGKVEIFLNDSGEVENAYLQVPELRGFEQFCVGRMAEDMPNITNRICGVCPEAHHMAAVKALDDLFNVEPTPTAKMIRELLYMAFFVTDHTTHFFALGGPDFIVGPDADPKERNIFGVINKVGLEMGKQVIQCRARNHHIIKILGGRGVHPIAGLPGGWSKSISEVERQQIEESARQNIEFALTSLSAFSDIVLKNQNYLELVTSDIYYNETYYMGTVDENNKVNFYDGQIRVIDPEGNEYVKYHPKDYANHIAERVESWTYLKFPYLKNVGWKGLQDGKESGVYVATPLSRVNVSDGFTTPLADEHYHKMYDILGIKKVNGRYAPIHHRLVTHWARLIELLYSAERMLELATHENITSTDVRKIPNKPIRKVGIGSVEAPRGTLTHHYVSDENGLLKQVNLIVGTTNNNAPISMSIKRTAQKLMEKDKSMNEDHFLNRIEMAFRLYDPCLSCATHALTGNMPLIVNIKNNNGKIIRTITNS